MSERYSKEPQKKPLDISSSETAWKTIFPGFWLCNMNYAKREESRNSMMASHVKNVNKEGGKMQMKMGKIEVEIYLNFIDKE